MTDPLAPRTRQSVAVDRRVSVYTSVCCLDDAGGDLVDVRRDAAGVMGVTLVDVTGHGRDAASAASRVGRVLADLNEARRNRRAWLARLNHRLCEVLGDERFGATISACVRPCRGSDDVRVSIANAGSPAVLVYRAAAGTVERLPIGNPPLGVFDDTQWLPAAISCTVRPGDVLVLMTDGVTEAKRPGLGLFGQSRVERILATLGRAGGRAVLAGLNRALTRYIGGAGEQDDRSIVVIEVTAAPREHRRPIAA
ncbi:MAG: PP2C family protein-serine/threonine phosphatase [Phycisphaerae bacterium]